MALAYQLRIKKAYAASLLRDLQRAGAIELIEAATRDSLVQKPSGAQRTALLLPGMDLEDVLRDLEAMNEEL